MERNVFDSPEFAEQYSSGVLGDLIKGREVPLRVAHAFRLLGDVIRGNHSILDIACATGNLETNLRIINAGNPVFGVDLSIPMLRKARELHPASPYVCACLPFLPFVDNAADIVVSLSTVNFTADPAASVLELMRVARRALIVEMFCHAGDGPVDTLYHAASGPPESLRLISLNDVNDIVRSVKNTFPLDDEPHIRQTAGSPEDAGFKQLPAMGLHRLFYFFILFIKKI